MSDFWDTADDPYAAMAERVGDAPSTGNEADVNPFDQEWTPPGPKADAFYHSDAAVCAIRGPVGSGKTTANLRKPTRRAITMPRSTIDGVRRYKNVIARATYRQLWNTTIPSYYEVFPRTLGTWSGGRGDPLKHTLTFEDEDGPVEYIAEFLAFGETEAEIIANVRGVQTTDFTLEEADTVHPILFTTSIGRIDRYPQKIHFHGGKFWPHPYSEDQQTYGQVNLSYNAPEEGNWIINLEGDNAELGSEEDRAVKKAIEQTGIRIDFFRQPGGMDPEAENLQHLSKGYYPRQVAIMKSAGRSHEVDRLVHNLITYAVEGDPVFESEFNRKIHVAENELEPWSDRPLLVGLDQGFFGAAVIAQFRPPYHWQILAEVYSEKRILARPFGRRLRNVLNSERFRGMRVEAAFGDMAGEAGNAAGLENENWNNVVSETAGIHIEPQMIGSNRIEPRLNVWRAAFEFLEMGRPGILICPTCKLLIRGLAAKYVWAEERDKAGNRTTKPKKRGCREADVIDAGGYVMLSEALPDGTIEADTPAEARRAQEGNRHNGGPPMTDDDWEPSDGLGAL